MSRNPDRESQSEESIAKKIREKLHLQGKGRVAPDETDSRLTRAVQLARRAFPSGLGPGGEPDDPWAAQPVGYQGDGFLPGQVVEPIQKTGSGEAPRVRKTVFGVSAALIVVIAACATIIPHQTDVVLGAIVQWVSNYFGWFYILTGTLVILFMLGVALSRSGKIRLGPDHSRPQYSLYSWTSMLFAAGIGVDLLFFSVAEPIAQYYQPPVGKGETLEAAKQAVVLTLFHYGLTGWAMYALMGMAFGYFAYRFNMPLTIRSALYPLIGKRIKGKVGDAVDIAAMLGTVFGVATSLGIGVVQLNYGLYLLLGMPQNIPSQLALIAVAVGVATVSAISGVDKGIKRLSEFNVGLAICLLLYIMCTGRTSFLLEAMVMNLGDYVSSFPGLTLETYAFSNAHDWLNSWTLFFWAWWVAWTPFVGLFLARISRGRTLRQFVIGTLSMPFLFIMIWVGIFGNSAIDRVFVHGDDEYGKIALEAPERAFYLLLEQYPLPTLVAGVASIVGLLLYITSADSAALVMSNFSSRITTTSSQDGPRWSRVFWAVATGMLTIGMLIVGGIPTLQSATIVAGLPFAIVIYLVMAGLYRSLRLESLHSEIAAQPASQRSWRQLLNYVTTYPSEEMACQFLEGTVRPALQQVAGALQEQGIDAVVEETTSGQGDHPMLTLRALGGEQQAFIYQVFPVAYASPSYTPQIKGGGEHYYRVEVFGLTGSVGTDLYGYSMQQVMADVLDRWEVHLNFLRSRPSRRGGPMVSEAAPETVDWSQDF